MTACIFGLVYLVVKTPHGVHGVWKEHFDYLRGNVPENDRSIFHNAGQALVVCISETTRSVLGVPFLHPFNTAWKSSLDRDFDVSWKVDENVQVTHTLHFWLVAMLRSGEVRNAISWVYFLFHCKSLLTRFSLS